MSSPVTQYDFHLSVVRMCNNLHGPSSVTAMFMGCFNCVIPDSQELQLHCKLENAFLLSETNFEHTRLAEDAIQKLKLNP